MSTTLTNLVGTKATFGQLYTGILALLILWLFLSAGHEQAWKLLFISTAAVLGPPILYLFAAASAAEVAPKPDTHTYLARQALIPRAPGRSPTAPSPDASQKAEMPRGKKEHRRRTSQSLSASSRDTSPTLMNERSHSNISSNASAPRSFKKLWRRSLSDPITSTVSLASEATRETDTTDGSTHFRPPCKCFKSTTDISRDGSIKRSGNKIQAFASRARRAICPLCQRESKHEHRPAAVDAGSALLDEDETGAYTSQERQHSIDGLLLDAAVVPMRPKGNLFKRRSSAGSLGQPRRNSATSEEQSLQFSSRSTTISEEHTTVGQPAGKKSLRLPKLFGIAKKG